ncbi:hypothetical protein ACFX2C_018098 [Malus domestica]
MPGRDGPVESFETRILWELRVHPINDTVDCHIIGLPNHSYLPVSVSDTPKKHHPTVSFKLSTVLVVPCIEDQDIKFMNILAQECGWPIKVHGIMSGWV